MTTEQILRASDVFDPTKQCKSDDSLNLGKGYHTLHILKYDCA